jgi:hypothetical protein
LLQTLDYAWFVASRWILSLGADYLRPTKYARVAEFNSVTMMWRRRWIGAGMKWWSKGRKPPQSWDPIAQQANVQAD